MSGRVRELSKNAFNKVGPKNPLNRLNPSDKELLFSTLFVYSRAQGSLEADEVLERAARVAAEGARLAEKLDEHVFKEPAADILREFLSPFISVPVQLRGLSALLSLDGKPGRKRDVFENQLLIMASEFVRMKLGSFYDEHVADLFQSFFPEDSRSEFSGDAIRKKRSYLKKEYPEVYSQVLAIAERMSRE